MYTDWLNFSLVGIKDPEEVRKQLIDNKYIVLPYFCQCDNNPDWLQDDGIIVLEYNQNLIGNHQSCKILMDRKRNLHQGYFPPMTVYELVGVSDYEING